MSDMRSMNRDVGDRVAERLAELQDKRTDAQMAEILGCTRVYYWQVKNRKRQISYEMAKRAAQTFPGIRDILIRDLYAEAV